MPRPFGADGDPSAKEAADAATEDAVQTGDQRHEEEVLAAKFREIQTLVKKAAGYEINKFRIYKHRRGEFMGTESPAHILIEWNQNPMMRPKSELASGESKRRLLEALKKGGYEILEPRGRAPVIMIKVED